MPKIIIVDRGRDKGYGFMKHLLENGAIPDPIKPLIESFMSGPKKPCSKNLWPEKNMFGVDNFDDLVMNHIYATSQEGVPRDIIEDIKKRLSGILSNASGNYANEVIKSSIMRGSKKVYKKELEDGTLVEVIVSKKVKDSEPVDGLEKLKNMKEEAKKESKEAVIDLDKAMLYFERLSKKNENFAKVAELLANISIEKDIILLKKEGEYKELFDLSIKLAAQTTNSNVEDVTNGLIASDEAEKNKVAIGEFVIDKRRLKEYPYNNKAMAEKALGQRISDMLYQEGEGGLSLDKVKTLYTASQGDSMLERVTNDVLKSVRWRGED